MIKENQHSCLFCWYCLYQQTTYTPHLVNTQVYLWQKGETLKSIKSFKRLIRLLVGEETQLRQAYIIPEGLKTGVSVFWKFFFRNKRHI